MKAAGRRRLLQCLAGLAAVAALLAGGAWYHLLRELPQPAMSDREFFKYGSVGVEGASGLPYRVWQVLPEVFGHHLPEHLPEHLPDHLLETADAPASGTRGYERFGFVWEAGRPTPVGFPVKRIGFERVGINCGLCHVAPLREEQSEELQLIVGAPSTTVDLQGYLRFLFAVAEDPRFDADTLLPAMEAHGALSLPERILYRYLIIPQTKRGLLEQKRELAFVEEGPDWGPGRQDPFNPAKIQILGQPYDGTRGNADIMSLWNWAARPDFALHWDGLNSSLSEIFLNSAIGNGASADSIDLEAVARVQRYVASLRAAPYPYEIDRELARRGHALFAQECARCHEFGGAKVGTVLPIAQLGTDPARMQSWTEQAKRGFDELDGYAWRYRHFRETHGYKAVALDGIWARAPYLHNGSVPSLRDLLEPPEARPRAFYRGYPVYDAQRVGFRYEGEEAERAGWYYDTRVAGNANSGHRYGTDSLSGEEKIALVEYLKLR